MEGEKRLTSRLNMTRRSFVKAAAITGAATVLASIGTSPAYALDDNSGSVPDTEGTVKKIRTCCRGCGKCECGVWVTVENGRAIKVEGDEQAFHTAGNCCSKSQASLQSAYHPDRLYHPMKRTNPRSELPEWERISWDEALELCGTNFSEIKSKYGGESLFTMCGTSRIWCMASALGFAQQMFESPNTDQAYQICKGPRHVATGWVSGRAYSWMATVDRPKVFFPWGGSSELSNYDDSCRTTVDVATKADYHIIVDPRVSNLGKEADIWLPLRPGTDAALALSLLDVVIQEELYDDLYVRRWTNAPFLQSDDIVPSGWARGELDPPIKTSLLKESDIQEGGSPKRFMVWDELNDRLTYFDVETGLWEGEVSFERGKYEAMQENLWPGVAEGYVTEQSDFSHCTPEILPALNGGPYAVTLKDGTQVQCHTVWELFTDRCEEYKPEIAEGITEVPADQIRKAARTYATRLDPSTGYGNGGIQYMLAVEHACNSIQNSRCCDALVGITGNFDTPAGNRGATIASFGEEFGMMSSVTGANTVAGPPNMLPDAAWKKMLGIEDIPMLWEQKIWADSTAIWDACNEGTPYQLHGGLCQSGDIMNMSNANYAYEGVMKLDFFAIIDLWHNPTSQLADVLLPARHWLEVDCPRRSQGSGGAEGGHCKCIEAPADTRYDIDIQIGLYKSMGVKWSMDPDDPWPDSIRELDAACEPLGMTWEEWKEDFQKNGWTDCKVKYPKWGTYRRYEAGLMGRTDTSGKAIPGFSGGVTGKQEIWSLLVETYYPGSKWCLPSYDEPPESPVADPENAKTYPYIMTTGRRIPVYFHSEHRQLPWCRELWPVPRIEINPEDAEELGVKQGDWVWIETKRGKIRQCVDLYYGIRKGTVNCEHQWWLPEFNSMKKGFDLVNVNTLVNKDLRDPLCGSSYARAYNVNIYKATPENCPNGDIIPCDDDGTEMIVSATDPRLKEWVPDYEIREEA